jgi:anti-anti-sigma regulatory factor
MNTIRVELSAADAPEVLRNLVQQHLSPDQKKSTPQSIVIDCQSLSSLDYSALQDLLRLRGICIFTGTHKLEACLQRYGISNLSDQLPSYSN